MSKALKQAIERNDVAAAAKAVKVVKNLARRMPGANTPVIYACQKGADAVIDVLLDAGAPAKGEDGYVGNSPFVVAMEHGHVDVMRRLHARSVVTAEQIDHAMFLAVLKGFVEPLRFMLAELRRRPAANLVHQATRSVKLAPALIGLLAEHGGDVNARWDDSSGGSGEGRLPIHTAAANGTPSAVRALVERGAHVNARDDKGRTPIMSFVRNLGGQRAHNANLERWARMKEEGADVETDATSDPAEPEATLAALLELGADATLADAGGNDALAHYEEEQRRDREEPEPAIVEMLRKAGARGGGVNAKVFEAILAKDIAAVRAALAAGADANAPTPGGATPLGAASYAGSESLIDVLLEAGADPNGYDGSGDTPLITAAVAGNLPVVKRLLAAGADLHRTERQPAGDRAPARNALLAAEWNRKYEVVDHLKSIGGTRPRPTSFEPLKPGVESWNDFNEIIVRADVKTTAAALAQMIKGTASENVYGQSFTPGRAAYVVVRPKGMNWSNVFRIAPPPKRFETSEAAVQIARSLAKAAGTSVLLIEYSDTSGTATVDRFEPDGTHVNLEDGWDRATLQEVVDELGDDATDAMKQRLAAIDEDDQDNSDGLNRLAEAEKFNVAALGFAVESGRAIDIEFAGYPAEAFDGVAWVSN